MNKYTKAKEFEEAVVSLWVGKQVQIVSISIEEIILKDQNGKLLTVSTEILTLDEDDMSILSFGDEEHKLGFFSRYNDKD